MAFLERDEKAGEVGALIRDPTLDDAEPIEPGRLFAGDGGLSRLPVLENLLP